jgi:hypothetical protein
VGTVEVLVGTVEAEGGLPPPSLIPTMSSKRNPTPQREDAANTRVPRANSRTRNHNPPRSEKKGSQLGGGAIPGSLNPQNINQTAQPPIIAPQTSPERDANQLGGGKMPGSRSPNSDNQTSPKTGRKQHTLAKKRQASPPKTTARNKKKKGPNTEPGHQEPARNSTPTTDLTLGEVQATTNKRPVPQRGKHPLQISPIKPTITGTKRKNEAAQPPNKSGSHDQAPQHHHRNQLK